jgi:hypothetical protein
MFGDSVITDPVSAGWFFLAALGLIVLLALAARGNASQLHDRRGATFQSTEPERQRRAGTTEFGLDADEVEDQDRRAL